MKTLLLNQMGGEPPEQGEEPEQIEEVVTPTFTGP